MHSKNLKFPNIEEPYDKLPKQLNSAMAKLFYCISRGAKNQRNGKNAEISHFFAIFKVT